MSQLMLVNPRRKKRRKSRRKTSVVGFANPRAPRKSRRRRARRVSAASYTAVRRGPRVGRRRRRGGGAGRKFGGLISGNIVNSTVIPAAMGGAGALAVDVAWGFLPLPAAIKTGPMGPVAKAAGAIVLGALATKFVGKQIGEKVATGYLTVLAYNLARGMLQKAMPNVPLSGYDLGYVSPATQFADPSISAYLDSDASASSSMNAYVNGYDSPAGYDTGYGSTVY